jgi:hypothetical protein
MHVNDVGYKGVSWIQLTVCKDQVGRHEHKKHSVNFKHSWNVSFIWATITWKQRLCLDLIAARAFTI